MARDGSGCIGSYGTLEAVRDRMVALCGDTAGLRVLDVGCGDGLIGRALLPAATRSGGTVTLLDIDVAVVEALAADLVDEAAVRCVVGDACTLDGIPDAAFDLVVMRAVLLYLPEKRAALDAAHRVLAPGGRLIVSEPVNRVLYDVPGHLWGYDLRAVPDLAERVRRAFMEDAAPEVRAMTDWTPDDLLDMVESAGFGDCRMEVTTEVAPGRALPWLAFLHARWTPWMPTVDRVLRERLTVEDRAELEAVLRPAVARGDQRARARTVFVEAQR